MLLVELGKFWGQKECTVLTIFYILYRMVQCRTTLLKSSLVEMIMSPSIHVCMCYSGGSQRSHRSQHNDVWYLFKRECYQGSFHWLHGNDMFYVIHPKTLSDLKDAVILLYVNVILMYRRYGFIVLLSAICVHLQNRSRTAPLDLNSKELESTLLNKVYRYFHKGVLGGVFVMSSRNSLFSNHIRFSPDDDCCMHGGSWWGVCHE